MLRPGIRAVIGRYCHNQPAAQRPHASAVCAAVALPGHAIYYALNLSCAKSDRQITLPNVVRWVQPNPKYVELHSLLGELINHDDYRYIGALVNHSKHRSIVSLALSFNLRKTGNGMKELVFPRFLYEGRDYPQRMVLDILEGERSRQGKWVIDIGNAINALARHR